MNNLFLLVSYHICTTATVIEIIVNRSPADCSDVHCVYCVNEQSAWRGYSLRRQLQYALKFVQFAADVDLSLPNFDVDAFLSKVRHSHPFFCFVTHADSRAFSNVPVIHLLILALYSVCVCVYVLFAFLLNLFSSLLPYIFSFSEYPRSISRLEVVGGN